MKKRIIIICILTIILGITPLHAYAEEEEYLDEINWFLVTINIRQDASADIRYDGEWHVLNDKDGEEPVSWIKIGIPNQYVDYIQPISDNIQQAEYSSEKGDFVRLDFKSKYYKDEVFKFSFTIHQTHLFKLEKDTLQYPFSAGWFEETPVKKITIRWRNVNVSESISDTSTIEVTEDGKYIYTEMENLPPGERVSMSVRVNREQYEPNIDEQYVERSSGKLSKGWIIVLIIIIIALLVLAAYSYDNGFGGGSYHSSGCACASCVSCASCACACACAGGGRAGCSNKDFYQTSDSGEKSVIDSLLTCLN